MDSTDVIPADVLGFEVADTDLSNEEFAAQLRDVQATMVARTEEVSATVQEMLHLLEVSKHDLDSLSGQGWFKRIWNTISGKNRKLAQVNEANLLSVQRLAVALLRILAENQTAFARAIVDCELRVRNVRVRGLKLQAVLLEVVRQASRRLAQQERRIERIEKRVDLHDWARARYDVELGNYDALPTMLRCFAMTARFAQMLGDDWNERDFRMLATTLEEAGVPVSSTATIESMLSDLSSDLASRTSHRVRAELVSPYATLVLPTSSGPEEEEEHGRRYPLHAALQWLDSTTKTTSPRRTELSDWLRDAGIDREPEYSIEEFVRFVMSERRQGRLQLLGQNRTTGGIVRGRDVPGSRRRGRGRPYWVLPFSSAGRRAKETDALREQLTPRAEAGTLSAGDFEALLGHFRDDREETEATLDLLKMMARAYFAAQRSEGDEDVLVECAKLLFRHGAVQEAYEWHARLAEDFPNNAELHNNLGFILLYLNRLEDARRELNKAQTLGFRDTSVNAINLGVCDVFEGRLNDAEQRFREAIEGASPTDDVAAEIVLFMNDSVVQDFDIDSKKFVLTSGATKAIAGCNLAYVLDKLSAGAAKEAIDLALEYERKACFPCRAMGWFLYSHERHREAVRAFENARRRSAKWTCPDLMDSLFTLPAPWA